MYPKYAAATSRAKPTTVPITMPAIAPSDNRSLLLLLLGGYDTVAGELLTDVTEVAGKPALFTFDEVCSVWSKAPVVTALCKLLFTPLYRDAVSV